MRPYRLNIHRNDAMIDLNVTYSRIEPKPNKDIVKTMKTWTNEFDAQQLLCQFQCKCISVTGMVCPDCQYEYFVHSNRYRHLDAAIPFSHVISAVAAVTMFDQTI